MIIKNESWDKTGKKTGDITPKCHLFLNIVMESFRNLYWKYRIFATLGAIFPHVTSKNPNYGRTKTTKPTGD